MSETSENSSIICPTLHHFGIETRNIERIVDWYAKVGVLALFSTIYSTSNALGSEPSGLAGAAFVSNDTAHHRIAILSLPELQEDTDKKTHVKLQHMAFEYPTMIC